RSPTICRARGSCRRWIPLGNRGIRPRTRRETATLGPRGRAPSVSRAAQAQEQCALAGCGTGYRTTRSWSLAFWGHLEPNVEVRFPNGVTLRLLAGYSAILNG